MLAHILALSLLVASSYQISGSGTGIGESSVSSEAAVEKQVGGETGSQEGDDRRIFKARLRGSLCASCLKQLEVRLKEEDGIESAHVFRPEGQPERAQHYATVEILYRGNKTSFKKIRNFIKRNDFGLAREVDTPVKTDNREASAE